MDFRIFSLIKSIFFLMLIPVTLAYQTANSQSKYGFDFDSHWTWEDLINKAIDADPSLLKSIDILKKRISIEDARIILNQLSGLDSIRNLTNILSVAKIDSAPDNFNWRSILSKSFDYVTFSNDFGGLIFAASKLSDLRLLYCKNKFQFKEREYLLQPVKDFNKKINISFNFNSVDKILNYFYKDTTNSEEIYETEPYKIILEDQSVDRIKKSDLQRNLFISSNENNLYSIYKWTNPQSFGNMGGVSIYKESFKYVVNSLKLNQENIKLDIEKHLSKYLPEKTTFNIDVMFLFGEKGPGILLENHKIGINLAYFGDDYNYLVRFIQHEIFIIAQKEIQLPVEKFVVEKYDKVFIEMLSNILQSGAANYVGPVGSETRPWYLLEKDFKLFNKAFKNIHKKNNHDLTDSLFKSGFSGDAPFYTMATQMGYIIESTFGRTALTDAFREGPIFFFSKYIESYKSYPDKIRNVFTFPEQFEEKISYLKEIFPEPIIRHALALKEYIKDTTKLNNEILKFISNQSNTPEVSLIDLYCGQLLLEAGEYNSSQRYFLKGISDQAGKGELAGDLGELFFERKAFKQALDFYNLYVGSSLFNAFAYEKRGIFYYKTGDIEKARNDFTKALVINPKSENARLLLSRINLEKPSDF